MVDGSGVWGQSGLKMKAAGWAVPVSCLMRHAGSGECSARHLGGKVGGRWWPRALRSAVSATADTQLGFSSLPSAEPARPVLPSRGVLHARAPGGQAPAPGGPEQPPQVLLRGRRPQCQDDARPLLLPGRQLRPQEEQHPQREGRPPAPQCTPARSQRQLQGLLSQVAPSLDPRRGGGLPPQAVPGRETPPPSHGLARAVDTLHAPLRVDKPDAVIRRVFIPSRWTLLPS